MKDIVIIANFCRDFSEMDNGRFMYLCKELSSKNSVEIITSDFNHSAKEKRQAIEISWPFKITFLHETGYKKNISIKRFLSHNMWGRNVEKYLEKRKKPDVIYCAVPSLTGPLKASKYCKKNDVKFIIDIQDLWPEAFKMAFDIPVISNFLFLPFTIMANKIYKNADEICAVSNTYIERALKVNNKIKMGHTVYLGTKIETFDAGANETPILKKKSGDLWLGYCGSLSASYDIPCVINALSILQEKKVTIPVFIVMGDGAKRCQFEELAIQKNVNCIFTGRLPYNQMCSLLNYCDIVINPIVKGSAASIINKHGDYAASGLPVLNTQDSPEYRELIDTYKMGLNCVNGDSDDVADKLLYLIKNEEDRKRMGLNARRCAEERFDRKNSYKELIKVIEG